MRRCVGPTRARGEKGDSLGRTTAALLRLTAACTQSGVTEPNEDVLVSDLTRPRPYRVVKIFLGPHIIAAEEALNYENKTSIGV